MTTEAGRIESYVPPFVGKGGNVETKIKDGKVIKKADPKKDDAKQPNLFGPDNKVFNTLETQISLVSAEINSQYEKIERAETVIKILDERRTDLKESRDIVRGRMDDFKSVKEKRSEAAKKREAEKKKSAEKK